MPTFPVLTIGPDADSLQISAAYPNFKAFQAENGRRTTRATHTWCPNIFKVSYREMSNQDRLDLQLFFETTVDRGADSFSWFNSQDFVTYTVKFFESLEFRHVTGEIPERLWSVRLAMIEHSET